MKDMPEFIQLIESWEQQRQHTGEFSRSDLDTWISKMNAHTKLMIAAVGRETPEFWSAVFELAQHASTMTTPGATINGIDPNRL